MQSFLVWPFAKYSSSYCLAATLISKSESFLILPTLETYLYSSFGIEISPGPYKLCNVSNVPSNPGMSLTLCASYSSLVHDYPYTYLF